MTTARLPLLLSAAACVAALAACGTDKEAKERCIENAYARAEVAVVGRMYDEGKVGTRARWNRALGGPGRPASSFFDANGHLRPWDELDVDHKNPLIVWIRTGPFAQVTEAARARAVARTKPDC